jgi:hypothetical protein
MVRPDCDRHRAGLRWAGKGSKSVRTPLIRHVRYEDFIALVSEGVGDLDGLRLAADTLVQQMGSLHFHHILVDLRRAVIAPIPEALLVEAMSYLRRLGVGVVNRVAFVTDPADGVRSERAQEAERIAALMGMHLHSFQDYSEALDWLNDPTQKT